MSSDFGTNKERIDIKVNCSDGYKTVKSIIKAINEGETVIKTSMESFNETYNNELCTALNGIGINDIRFGTMTHYIGGGVGYTLYKERVMYQFSGERDHDQFVSRDDLGETHWNILMSCHHSGSCDDDCNEASKYFKIEDIGAAQGYILDCGVEDESLQDENGDDCEHTILSYYLWMLAGDIQELEDCEEVTHN